MRLFIALILPWLAFFTIKRPFAGIIEISIIPVNIENNNPHVKSVRFLGVPIMTYTSQTL